MICPITDKPCRTNGCGEKCYKRDSLGYSTAPQHDAKLPIISSALVGKKLPTKDGGWLKIMAFCDNYYMARFKGCIPFCCNEKELKERIEAHCL